MVVIPCTCDSPGVRRVHAHQEGSAVSEEEGSGHDWPAGDQYKQQRRDPKRSEDQPKKCFYAVSRISFHITSNF